MSFPLSVLDLVPLPQGVSAGNAIRNSLELARLADRLGYRRVWYAEHHNMATIASTTPEIMIALAGEATTKIRVGSGGIMLPNHSSLKVAESFKMLEALHPNRVDLGIGRAPGTDPVTAIALRGSRQAVVEDNFPTQMADLLHLNEGALPGNVSAIPAGVPLPNIFLLGSSDYSAHMSAALGLGFGFAAHFSDFPPEGPMLAYRREFMGDKPHAILTVSAITADTDEEAERLLSSVLVSFARLRTGQKPMLLPPEEALVYPFNLREQSVVDAIRDRQIVGTPEKVKATIEELAHRTKADEVMVTTMIHSHAARMRSYELLAGAFGLAGAQQRELAGAL
ncbi:LLM class flavin-dependent oxidoreductase [bacterium]|nr:MAG: LLM class flavin-dependent oxidoreductase [bacterium]